MNVESHLKRTNKTNLIDEELLVLDVLFDSSDIFESLVKENYGSWHNLPYSHGVETGILRDLVDKLIGDGIVTSQTSSPGNKVFYALTEAGGKLWEAERAPDWERYCTYSSTPEENGNWILVVESPSIATAKAFVDCADRCRLYGFNQDEIRVTTSIEKSLSTVYWMVFPTVCSMSVTMYPLPNITLADWNEYENRRIWWSSLTALQKFQLL